MFALSLFLLCVCVCVLVAQLCLTLCDPVDGSQSTAAKQGPLPFLYQTLGFLIAPASDLALRKIQKTAEWT